MVRAIFLTSTLAFAALASTASLEGRFNYNDGQLISPQGGIFVTHLSTLNFTYQAYDSIDGGTKYITLGFEVAPDLGIHTTYPVGQFDFSSPGSQGSIIRGSFIVPRTPGNYCIIATDYQAFGANQDLVSVMTANESVTVV